MKNEEYKSDPVQACHEAYEAYVKARLNKLETDYGIGYDGKIGLYVEEKDRSWCTSSSSKLNKDAMQFNVKSFIDDLEEMKPNDYIFNRPRLEQNFGELILNTNKKEWDFVFLEFWNLFTAYYMKWREYQLYHIGFDDAYLSNYKIADPDCDLDRHRFAATYCGALDDLKAKADSMIYSVIEYYLPMFDDIEENEEGDELGDELPELRSDNN